MWATSKRNDSSRRSRPASCGLDDARLRQVDVGPPGEPVLLVPGALAVAQEDEAGHGSAPRCRGQAAARRAAAVRAARATIPAISSGLSDAPPTSAPSMPGSARNSPMFALGHAAAVEDRDRRRRARPQPPAAERRADRVGHGRGVRAAARSAGADRPDRLVGDDDAARRASASGSRPCEGARPAGRRTTSSASAGLAIGEHLADAQDGPQAARPRRGRASADQLVGLAEVAAPLGVAEDAPTWRGRPASARDTSPV